MKTNLELKSKSRDGSKCDGSKDNRTDITRASDRTLAGAADKGRQTRTTRRPIAQSHDRRLGVMRIVSNSMC